MVFGLLLLLPPLAVALAYGRAPFFVWTGVGLIWLLRRKKRKQTQPEEKSRDVSG